MRIEQPGRPSSSIVVIRIVSWVLIGFVSIGLTACGPASEPNPPPFNLVLFVIDTLRADRVGIYGNPRATSPNLDAFARDALVFDNAYAPAPHTAPSHASLFSSTYPATHGVWNSVKLPFGQKGHPRLSNRAKTLAEVLEQHGFRTGAITDGGWVNPGRGLGQGFESFTARRLGVKNRMDLAIEWLEAREPADPFFLFLHTYQVHAPYIPPEGYEDRFGAGYQGPIREALAEARKWMRAENIDAPPPKAGNLFFRPTERQMSPEDVAFLLSLYDAEISVVDEAFEQLVAYLSEEDLLDHTLIVITSDHGEEFAEHGRYNHNQLYTEGLRIPLIVRHPQGQRGTRRSDLVDLVDLMPSILGALALPIPESAQGRDLALHSAASIRDTERLQISEVNREGGERNISVRSANFTAIFHDRALERAEVYARSTDPEELTDISNEPGGARFLSEARAAVSEHWVKSAEVREKFDLAPENVDAFEITREQRDELKVLGYIDP